MQVFMFFIILFSNILAIAGPIESIKSLSDLEKYLTDSNFSGVLAARKNNEHFYKKSFGTINIENGRAINAADKFQMGSVTKQFVAVSLLKLQQDGKLNLDMPISTWLPKFKAAESITVRQLLNHTSGIANYTDIAEFWSNVGTRVLNLDEIIQFMQNRPLDFQPGTNWKYSNTGYILAGKIVELVSLKSWSDFIIQDILSPLYINGIGYTPFFENVSEVKGYVQVDDDLKEVKNFNLSWALSAGALYSDIDGLLDWTAIYFKHDILNQTSLDQFLNPNNQGYALGVKVQKWGQDLLYSHGGRTPGFTTSLNYLKNEKLAVASFSNHDHAVGDPSQLLLQLITKGKSDAIKLKPYPIKDEALNEYVGLYENPNMKFNVFIKDRRLHLQPDDGQPAYALIPNDRDSFRLLTIAGEEFIRDENGQITELRHYQGGAVSIFKRSAK